MRSLTSFCLLLTVGILSVAGRSIDPGPAPARFEFSDLQMGTQFKIILYCDSSRAATLASSAFKRIAEIDAITSDYRETSELMSLCRAPAGSKVTVSEDLFRVLERSQEMAERSGGAFDVTVGPVVRLWRHARRVGELPDRARLARAMELVGYRKLHLDRKSRSASLERAGMLLDLGGIAKGYAADQAMAILKKNGVTQALIAAGGDILVSGAPPGTRGWVIEVTSLEPANEPKRELCLRDRAVSTSGDAQQHVEIGGVRYSHIVDPKTGLGLKGRSSVTVVAADCTTSDALATAAAVLGAARGSKLVEATRGAAGLFTRATGDGVLMVETNRWKREHRGRCKSDRRGGINTALQ